MKCVYKAESIIQRDAILNYLESLGISAMSPPKDISRRLADGMVDLSYGAYSVLAEGFSIMVPIDQADEAEAAIASFLKSVHQQQGPSLSQEKSLAALSNRWNQFLIMGLTAIFLTWLLWRYFQP